MLVYEPWAESLDFISLEEIIEDYQFATRKYHSAELCFDSVDTDEELRELGENVFSLVNERFPKHYKYSTKHLSYKDLDDDIMGQALFPSLIRWHSTIYIDPKISYNAATVAYVLAHEATHTALRNLDEWVEELVALDVAYQMFEDGAFPDMEQEIYHTKKEQTLDAMAFKLRDMGYSELELARYMHYECGVGMDKVTDFANVKLGGKDFKSYWLGGNMNKIKEKSAYFSKPYFAEKYMAKTQLFPELKVGFKKFSLKPERLLSHTDDARKQEETI